MLTRHLEMHFFIRSNVMLRPTKVGTVPKMTHEEASKMRSSLKYGRGRRSVS